MTDSSRKRVWRLRRPPSEGLDKVDLKTETLPKETVFFRVQPKGKPEAFYFAHDPDNRMSSEYDPPRRCECYAALESDVAVHETVFWNPRQRDYFECQIEGLELAEFTLTRPLQALKLGKEACAPFRLDISVFTGTDVGLSRAWSSALYEWRGGLSDGLIFPARTGGDESVAIFDRAQSALKTRARRTPVLEWRNRDGERISKIVERMLDGVWHPK